MSDHSQNDAKAQKALDMMGKKAYNKYSVRGLS
jgi:hypothetical protein